MSGVSQALDIAADHLLSLQTPEGYWEGWLSSSALSTATAVSALFLGGIASDREFISSGMKWLESTQNPDGGWGDTIDSPSNLATTLLTLSAMIISLDIRECKSAIEKAQSYIVDRAGTSPEERVAAIHKVYGKDRTFAVPILMNCALAGLVDWRDVPGLPFELAVLPRSLYKALKLHVVSYALPALIAVGALIESKNPAGKPSVKIIRRLTKARALAKLTHLQPSSGGFLEAVPLTAFVAMCLASLDKSQLGVLPNCLGFLRDAQRSDGSWPIDSNLSVWVTTGAVSALLSAGRLTDANDRVAVARWIAERQYRETHPFTGAAPGGWGWTHLPGGVPDTDDTSGAIIALNSLGENRPSAEGVKWLLGVQNSDGGWPTFCRGWGQLPFDQSTPDITAHVIRALLVADKRGGRIAIARGIEYLRRVQKPNGSWVPLWFGNQVTEDHSNSVFGTARVLIALAEILPESEETLNGLDFLLAAQNSDGGWGGSACVQSTVEETAQSVIALSKFANRERVMDALKCGAEYLKKKVENGTWLIPSPIGLYFASLWYSEELYPVIWTVEALACAVSVCNESK